MSSNSSTSKTKATCPCCYYVTLEERNNYEICSVCYWEDEGEKWDQKLDLESGANHGITLREARRNFNEFGASDRKWVDEVIPKENRSRYKFNPP
jgi:hypothetical protein